MNETHIPGMRRGFFTAFSLVPGSLRLHRRPASVTPGVEMSVVARAYRHPGGDETCSSPAKNPDSTHWDKPQRRHESSGPPPGSRFSLQ